MGPWTLAASIISMIVGAGIFAAPAALAASVGPYAPVAFLACGLAMSMVAICFAEGGSRVPTSGGVYGVIEAAFGPMTGYVAGILLCVGNVLACGGIAAAFGDVIASLLPQQFAAGVRVGVIISFVGGMALVNISGVRHGARLVGATTVIKLFPLVVFIVAGLGAVHPANFHQSQILNAEGVGHAIILAVFAYVGMESSLCASGEVIRPNRTIPRALGIAMASMIVLYVLIQVVAQGILGSALASSHAPLADAMGRVHPALRALLLAGTAISMFGWMGSDLLGSPRQIFAFARDGQLPRILGRVHPRTHAPHIAIICYAAIAILLALFGTFAELAVLSALPIVSLYTAGCAASWVLVRRGVALAGPPLNFPFIGTATVISVSSMLAVIAMGTRQEILALLCLIGGGVLVYYLLKARAVAVNQ